MSRTLFVLVTLLASTASSVAERSRVFPQAVVVRQVVAVVRYFNPERPDASNRLRVGVVYFVEGSVVRSPFQSRRTVQVRVPVKDRGDVYLADGVRVVCPAVVKGGGVTGVVVTG